MNCNACHKTRPLNSCSDEIAIGTFEPNTDYYVYLEIVATGHITRLEATSENDGLLPINVEDIDFATTLEYMLWVTLQSANSQHNNVTFTASDGADSIEGVSCLLLNFEKIMDGDRCCLCIGTQTIILIPTDMTIGENDFIDQNPQGGTYGLLTLSFDGTDTIFTVSENIYKSGTLRNYNNGQLLQNGVTWVETTPGSGKWKYFGATFPSDIFTSIYQKP